LFIALGSQITVEEIDTTAGQIIFYNAMGQHPPKYAEIPPFANYVYNEVDRMKGDIRTIASVTEQEAGLASPDTSGRYAAILEAQADQQVGPVIRYNNSEWIELGRGILTLCQTRYTEERRWTITGTDRPVTYEFGEMNLNPGWDIDIQEDDSLSTNKAVRLQQVINLVPTGAYSDQATGTLDRKSFARAAHIKLPGVGPESGSADHSAAAAIPGLIKSGKGYEPRAWDDPDVFAEELEAWLKGPGRTEDPGLVEQVAGYWKMYVQLSQDALQQQQATAQMAQGAAQQPVADGGNGSASPEPDVLSDARQMEQAADQAAEATAQIQTNHEG
jgi:hypothetical protein